MKRAVVLDRDGVINDNRDIIHVNKPSQFVLFDGVPEAIRRLNGLGFLVLVATNQGGVGLGFLSEEGLSAIHTHMNTLLEEQGARLDGIAACTHAPRAGCSCRKPKPGLLMQLQQEFGFDPHTSFMVGDRETDIEAGRAAGMRTIFIGSETALADHCASGLPDAVAWIAEHAMD